MLKVENLTITTHKGRCLLKDFSHVINDGDKTAFIGEEGNGKSTILKIMAGIDVSDYVSHEGSIQCFQRIGYMPQKIDDDKPETSALSFVTSNNPDIDYAYLYSLVGELNIHPDLLNRDSLSSMSGGEKVKLSLLRVLYQNPEILLLDEPTNDLDLKTLLWLESFIQQCELPMIFISHDESLLENCSNSILHLEQLKRKSEPRITFHHIGYKEYQHSRRQFIERNNMIARKEKAEFDKQMEKWRRIYQKVEQKQSGISRGDPHGAKMLKKKMHAVKSQERLLEEKRENLTDLFEPEEAINIFFNKISLNPNKVILEIKDKRLKTEDRVLIESIDLTILGKDKICFIGDNGCGKSTLIKQIYQQLKDRKDIKVGYMPQNYYEVCDYQKTPIDYLLENHEYTERARIQSHLGALKFTTEEMTHKIEDLSEGQKAKILLVKLIIDDCDVLILDEPTRNLSPLSNPVIRNILNEYGGCIIAVSHDRKFIEDVCDTVYLIENKTISRLM